MLSGLRSSFAAGGAPDSLYFPEPLIRPGYPPGALFLAMGHNIAGWGRETVSRLHRMARTAFYGGGEWFYAPGNESGRGLYLPAVVEDPHGSGAVGSRIYDDGTGGISKVFYFFRGGRAHRRTTAKIECRSVGTGVIGGRSRRAAFLFISWTGRGHNRLQNCYMDCSVFKNGHRTAEIGSG